uniref:Putative secreted protein n=1 Tax=Ixodes ricinus TaxID=34613 RepID=A0A6B0UI73_IXORI
MKVLARSFVQLHFLLVYNAVDLVCHSAPVAPGEDFQLGGDPGGLDVTVVVPLVPGPVGQPAQCGRTPLQRIFHRPGQGIGVRGFTAMPLVPERGGKSSLERRLVAHV